MLRMHEFCRVERDGRILIVTLDRPKVLNSLNAPACFELDRIFSEFRVPVYGGSKAALEAHTAAMAKDLAGTGVTANVLVPGGAAVSRMTMGLGVPRERLIPAEVMAPPTVWLASDASNSVSGRRFIARKWDVSIPPSEAAELAGDPVAWTGYGAAGVQPG
jgi:3-oxoacyl-[acyl-carrier protein] reductase